MVRRLDDSGVVRTNVVAGQQCHVMGRRSSVRKGRKHRYTPRLESQ